MKKFLKLFLLTLIILIPLFTFSQGLVPCDGSSNNPCDYNSFITLINNVVNFIVIYLAIPLAAIAFAYAGFLFLTSAENPGKRTQAKSIFVNVLIGLLLVGGSYLIIKTVLSIFGYESADWLGF